jgi:hypothetical protein
MPRTKTLPQLSRSHPNLPADIPQGFVEVPAVVRAVLDLAEEGEPMRVRIPPTPAPLPFRGTLDSAPMGDRFKIHFYAYSYTRGKQGLLYRATISGLSNRSQIINGKSWEGLWKEAHAAAYTTLNSGLPPAFIARQGEEGLRDFYLAKSLLESAKIEVSLEKAVKLILGLAAALGAAFDPKTSLKAALRGVQVDQKVKGVDADSDQTLEEVLSALKEFPGTPIQKMLAPFRENQKWMKSTVMLAHALREYRAELADPDSLANRGKSRKPGGTTLGNWDSYFVRPLHNRVLRKDPALLLSDFASSPCYVKDMMTTPTQRTGRPWASGQQRQILDKIRCFLEWGRKKAYLRPDGDFPALSYSLPAGTPSLGYHNQVGKQSGIIKPTIYLSAVKELTFDSAFQASLQASSGSRGTDLHRVLIEDYLPETGRLDMMRAKRSRYHQVLSAPMRDLMKQFEGCYGLLADPAFIGFRTLHMALQSVTAEKILRNGLRHLGIAVMLAKRKENGLSVAEVAGFCGTSEKTIMSHYASVITDVQANQVWNYVPPLPRQYVITNLHVRRRFFGTIDMLLADARRRGCLRENKHSLEDCLRVVEPIIVEVAQKCREATWPKFTTKVKSRKIYDASEYLDGYRSEIYDRMRRTLKGETK